MTISKIIKKAFALAVAIFAAVGQIEAQNAVLEGRVVDSETGEAMPFVNVALMRTNDTVFLRGATTAVDGKFSIVADTGSYLLQASFVGYHTVLRAIHIINDVKGQTIEMQRGTMLEVVEVAAERPLYVMDGEKNMYNTKEDPSIKTGTISDALQNAPGVEVDAEGNITLRGVSSVEIWINDRPSHMNEEALKQYIKTMPADAIERIEVITNPSVRYSTTGGVINIVTNQTVKRNELLCLGLTGRTSPSISPWLSYVYANEKVDFNIYLNGNFMHHRWESSDTTTMYNAARDTILRHTAAVGKGYNNSLGGYLGGNINWRIDDKTTLAAWAGVYPYWYPTHNESRVDHYEYTMTPWDWSYGDTADGRSFWGGGYAGAWFEHRYDTTGRKLSITLSGNGWTSRGSDTTARDYRSALMTDYNRAAYNNSFSPSFSLGANYTQPLKNKWELEMGVDVEGAFKRDFKLLDSLVPATGAWNNIGMRSSDGSVDHFDFEGYITAQKRWGGFTAKAGIRGGQCLSWVRLNHREAGEQPIDVFMPDFDVEPSLHLSYRTKDFHNFSLSFTMRHSHNTAEQEVDFRTYDDNSFSTGNPDLDHSEAYNVEAAWSKFFMGFGSVGLSAYMHANAGEVGSAVLVWNDYDPYFGARPVNYTMPVNIGSSHTEGAEANITYRPTPFLNVRLNASVFNYAYNYDDFSDSKVSWSARLNIWTKLWNRLEVFANARYTSPRLGLYSMSVPNKGIDLGLTSDFFNRQLSVYLNVNDIFGMAEWGSNTTAPQYQTTGSTRYDSRFVSLGLTWRIGKMELESKARQGATDTGSTPQM